MWGGPYYDTYRNSARRKEGGGSVCQRKTLGILSYSVVCEERPSLAQSVAVLAKSVAAGVLLSDAIVGQGDAMAASFVVEDSTLESMTTSLLQVSSVFLVQQNELQEMHNRLQKELSRLTTIQNALSEAAQQHQDAVRHVRPFRAIPTLGWALSRARCTGRT